MKAHEVVMEWVAEELRSGRLRIGDRLPGERALAETLEVSRGSLREALRVLEALGTIRTGTGSGPTAGTVITAAPEQALLLALNQQLATKHVDYEHIYEVRVLFETWAARHAGLGPDAAGAASAAASGDTSGDAGVAHTVWKEIDGLLARMERIPDGDAGLEEFLALDAAFHVALSRVAGNPLISTFMDALRMSIADHTLARARAVRDRAPMVARLRDEHREIRAAYGAGDGARAAELLEGHIRGFYRDTAS